MTFLALCFFGYLEYRRRVKKAAMERYAMKRMRRKFKAMQRDIDGRAVDWRSLYMESKEQEIVGQEKKKDKDNKKRDKKAEKREKEKQKREKEREKTHQPKTVTKYFSQLFPRERRESDRDEYLHHVESRRNRQRIH
jgi:hypothetical protein